LRIDKLRAALVQKTETHAPNVPVTDPLPGFCRSFRGIFID
jgi:hypothetical protein